jgi:tRNA U34 2-thiouridine synthase MnmA/TrmU
MKIQNAKLKMQNDNPKLKMGKARALVLFSGGLDSILACKILKEQKIDVVPVFFKSYFFGPEIAQKSAKENGLNLRIEDISKEHLEIVKKPKFGWGASMNPCLDCHILMLKKAKEIMKKENFDFVATGEVLGERPFSQTRNALLIVERESSLKGYLLRPLSAKLLEPTIPEKNGLVKRERLFDIEGRSRKRQMELAKKFKIKWYPQPSGGCILTDLEFGKKLRELLEKYPEFDGNDVETLKLGRHFWEGNVKIIIGRNHEENLKLEKIKRKGDFIIKMKNYPGPTALIRSYQGKVSDEILEKAKELILKYSKKTKGKKDVKFLVKND